MTELETAIAENRAAPDSLAHTADGTQAQNGNRWTRHCEVEGLPVAGPALLLGPPQQWPLPGRMRRDENHRGGPHRPRACPHHRLRGPPRTVPMDRVRAAAVGAPAWLRDWVNTTTPEEEAAHARQRGGWFGDGMPPASAN